MTTALAPIVINQGPAPMPLNQAVSIGEIFAKSGFFKDSVQAAQAVTKILAGAEIGVPPFASMAGIWIVQGKLTFSANLMATVIKRSGRYTYRIRKHTDQECEIEFFENGESLGVSGYTIAEAQKAKLADKDIWKAYPRNMLFARALSNGAKWHCADVFGGAAPYTPDELGADVDQDGQMIEAQVISRNGVEVIKETGEIVERPAPDLSKLRASYGRGVEKAAGLGLAAPPLPDDADEMTIRQMAADIQAAIKVAHEVGYPVAFGGAVAAETWPIEDLRQDITSASFVADPTGHLRETMKAWDPGLSF